MPGPTPRPAIERVLEKVEMVPFCGCWIFTGASAGSGGEYGGIGVGCRSDGTNRMEYVHRVVYEALVGPIPHGKELDHVAARGCASKACCNPDHLEPVDHPINVARGRGGRRTHCPQGHEYGGDNLWVRPRDGRRECRACNAAHRKRYWSTRRPSREAYLAQFKGLK
jgi:hypothetical protein